MTRRCVLVGRGRPEAGGIAVALEQLAALDDPDWTVELLNLTPERREAGGSVTVANVARTLGDAVSVLRSARRADVVHIHSAMAPRPTAMRAGVLALAAKVGGAKTVLHCHGGRVLDLVESGTAPRWLSHVLGRADVVVAAAESVAEALTLATSIDVEHVPNGVDLTRFGRAPEGAAATTPRVLFVGILTERKGVLDLLAASETVMGRGVEHELAIVGGTPDEGAAEHDRVAQAVDASSAPTVMMGEVDHGDLPALYASAAVFCLPSWWEAMPLTVLEAMASAVPVVASDVGDIRRMLDDGRAGTVVPARDRAALADALELLLTDEATRRALGGAGRTRAERQYDLEAFRERFVEIYEDLVR